ncbi:MAG: DUF4185 domain-containing protein [Myxococcota bacterium]
MRWTTPSFLLFLLACSSPPSTEDGSDSIRTRIGTGVLNIPRPVEPPHQSPELAGSLSGNPSLVQSRFGSQGNFEVAVPAAGAGLLYYWRDNDHGAFWNGPDAVFTDQGHIDALSMIQSNFGDPGNMEMVVRRGDRLGFAFRENLPKIPWHGIWDIASGVDGTPSMIQSSFGAQGNFEVVVPSAGRGLLHFWRDNDHGMTWNGPTQFFAEWGHFDAVSIIQSNYGQNFEGIARRGDELLFFYWDGAWKGPWHLGSGAAGNPSLIQSRFGAQGNFELVVPSTGGGVDYYWRDNDHGMTWNGPYRLFGEYGAFDAVSLIQSNYGDPGNLELVMRRGQSMTVAWRVNVDPWSGPVVVTMPTDPAYSVEGTPLLRRGYSEYLGNLTKNSQSLAPYVGISGTDLGVAFDPGDGSVGFLFGDSATPGQAREAEDSVAQTWAASVDQAHMPLMTWSTRGDNQFAACTLPGVDAGGMNVPLDAVRIGNTNYVYANSGWRDDLGTHDRIALATMDGLNPETLSTKFVMGTVRFTNLSTVLIGNYVYLFGAGEPYRFGAVYLARVRTDRIEDPNSYEYYRGVRGGIPVFGPGEGTAVPLFSAGLNWELGLTEYGKREGRHGIGELSVRMHQGNKLVLTYAAGNGPSGRGIYLRTAETPWGPWSAGERILSDGEMYGRWQHMSVEIAHVDDGLSDRGRENTWGGEYGPYLIPQWFTDLGADTYGLVFTLSSWNPYQSHLVRVVVTGDGHAISRPARGLGLPKTQFVNPDFAFGLGGWVQLGGPFVTYGNRVTTFGDDGDATTGAIYQDLSIDSTTTRIRFTVHGGHGTVKLYWAGQVIREVHGWNTNAVDTPVEWNIEDYQGESLRFVVEDLDSDPWGFVDVGDIQVF